MTASVARAKGAGDVSFSCWLVVCRLLCILRHQGQIETDPKFGARVVVQRTWKAVGMLLIDRVHPGAETASARTHARPGQEQQQHLVEPDFCLSPSVRPSVIWSGPAGNGTTA